MDKLITEQLKLKDLNPKLAQSIAKEYGIKEEEVQLVRKGLTPADVKFEEGERAAISYITTNAVDRDKEIIDPKGAVLKDYRKNPVVLFGHDYRSLPIGKNEWIKSDDKGLIAKTIYAEHEEADKVYQYRKAGFPLAESIGFIPLKFRDLDEAEQKANGGARRIYDKWILLEYSDVAVPSNPQALEIAISKGLIQNTITKIDNSGTTLQGDELEVTADDIVLYQPPVDKLWEDLENEIRYRIRNPELFQSDSFRRIPIKRSSSKIFGIAGKLKGEDGMTLQSLRFPKDEDWTLVKTQKWVKDHPDVKTVKLEEILLKILQEEEQVTQKQVEKEGRVLSQKNRTLVKQCIEVLSKLVAATEPEPKKELDMKEKYNKQLNDLMNQVADLLKKVE